MSSLTIEIVEILTQTLTKVVPVTIALALIFSVLSHFWACNPGTPWWRKRELVTDISYWFLVPLFARVFRIALLVLAAALFFDISDADELIAFYNEGHGPLSVAPLWLQAVLFLVLADFMMYWLHRMFHGGGFWKYHAIHHSSEDVDWISAARFHPVNLLLGTIGVDVVLLTGGHFAERDALARSLQYFPFGVRPRQSELGPRPVQICDRDAGVSPLASHRAERGRQYQFRRHFSDLGHSVRDVPDAGKPAARPITASTIKSSFPTGIGGTIGLSVPEIGARRSVVARSGEVSRVISMRSLNLALTYV